MKMSVSILQRFVRQSYVAYTRFASQALLSRVDNVKRNFEQATAAFAISTIVLAVDNADLKGKLEDSLAVTYPSLPPITEPPVTNPPVTDPPVTVPPVTDPPITDPPLTDPPLTDPPVTDPPVTEPPDTMAKYRLPKTAVPTTYDLYLYPDLDTGLFRGTVSVATNVTETTTEIVMHSHLLTVTQVSVDGVLGEVEPDPAYELITIRKSDGSEFLEGTTVDLTVEYEGDMKDRIVGLYISSYENPEGDKRFMATSKFEPTYARQAFPCFDEPNLKATYKVHLLKPKDTDYIALSNNPQIDETEEENGIMVHFGETVPMSTYLSCFIVSDFKSSDTTFDNDGVDIPFRVFASPHQQDKTIYAGEVGKAVIEYYVRYFKIPYPLPKLDMVAIPDFVSGAMEHWGLVTYRETALLYDPSTHSASNKQRVAEVVAHELAHSWFGNLVTMDWWDQLWLNEGFATYIADKGVHAHHPDWKMAEQFQINTLHSILSLDATQASHPIIQKVETPDQITEVFDSVSYNKGAAVLRMLEAVVTSDNFEQGVTNYLNTHRYGNTVSQNLWDEIQTVVGNDINVTEFMDTFTVQMGYPVLEARVDGNTYTFTQKRFLKDYESARKQKSSPLNYKWSIPVTFVTDLGVHEQIHWFNHDADDLSITKPEGAKWIKFNPNQVGYYRVNYAEDDWNVLIENIRDLSVADKTHLLEESFSIAESGDLSYTIPLTLTKYLVDETEYVPWSVASSQLQSLSKYLQTSQYDSAFKTYVINLLKPTYDQLGWDDSDDTEPHLKKLTRVLILNLACAMDYDVALNEAKTRFDAWIADTTTTISPNLRTMIYKFGMVTADEATWNKVFDLFTKEPDANEKLKLMNGLANVRNPSLLTKLIELARDETYVRGQDYFTLLQYISANPVGTPIVWDFVRENWPYLVDRFGLNERYLGRMIPSITSRFLINLKLEEMQHFFTKYPEAGAGAAARLQALETVSNNIKWLEKHRAVVEDWISQQE